MFLFQNFAVEKNAQVGSVNPRSCSPCSCFTYWLKAQGKTPVTIKETKNYAIKYGHILDTADTSSLVVLSPCNRRHAMTALAALAKFQGRYGRWLDIRYHYQLKWSLGNNSLQALQRFFNTNLTLESMLSKIR